MAGKPLDETDRRFFQHLRQEGRRSDVAIVCDIGRSEVSSRRRFAHTPQDKVVSIAATTFPTSLGLPTAGSGGNADGGRGKNISPARAFWAIDGHH